MSTLERHRNFVINVIDNIKASDKENIETLDNYLKNNNFHLNDLNDEIFDILIYAIDSRASQEVIKFVIEHCPYINYNYDFYVTDEYRDFDRKYNYFDADCLVPLFCAVRNEYFEIADILIKRKKADINYVTEDGENIVSVLYFGYYGISNSSIKYILKRGFYIRGFPIELINHMMFNESNNDLVELVLKKYIFDNMFILNMLSIYKHKTPLTNKQIDTIIRNEKSKIKIEDVTYSNAIRTRNVKILESLLKYDSDTSDVIIDRIHEYDLLELCHNNEERKGIKVVKEITLKKLFSLQQPILEELFMDCVHYHCVDMVLSMEIVKFFKKTNFDYLTPECENVLLAASKVNSNYMDVLLKCIMSKNKDPDIIYKMSIKNSKAEQDRLKKLLEITDFPEFRENIENTLRLALEATDPLSIDLIKEGDAPFFSLIVNIALKLNNLEVLKFLLDNKDKINLDLNVKDRNGDYPMIVALSRKTNNNYNEIMEFFKYLMDHGANGFIQENNISIINIALITKKYISLKYLLSEKYFMIKNSVENDSNSDALSRAICQHDFDKIKELITENKKTDLNNMDVDYEYNMNINSESENNMDMDVNIYNHSSEINMSCSFKYTFTPLCLAYILNEKEIFDYLIKEGFSVNELDDHGYGVLHFMVLKEDLEMVKYLITTMDVNVNLRNDRVNRSDSALDISVNNSSKEMTMLLLSSPNLIVDEPDNQQELPIITILKSPQYNNDDKFTMVQCLLDKHSDVNVTSNTGISALGLAVQTQHIPLVKLLVDHGADVNFVDENKNSPLAYAIQVKSEPIVSLFIEHGADADFVDIFDIPLLAYAIKEKELALVKHLVDHGANVNYIVKNNDYDKMHPLFFHAICEESFPIVKYLLEHGVEYDFKSEDKLCDLMPLLFISFRQEILEYLLETKIDAHNLTIKTLQDLLWRDRNELLKILIKHGLNVELTDEEEKTLLMRVVRMRRLSLTTELIESGADIEKVNQHIDCLSGIFFYHEYNDSRLLSYLIEHGLDVNAQDEHSDTPLIYAIKNHHCEFVKLLLASGANPNYVNEHRQGRPSIEMLNEDYNLNYYFKEYKQIHELLQQYIQK